MDNCKNTAEPQQHYSISAEARLSILEWGSEFSGQRSTLVLVHATGFHGRCWDQVVSHLEGRHVLAVELRGHGRSEAVAFEDWRSLGEDLEKTLTSFGVSAAIGIGHSMGGVATLYAAYLAADLFSKILLIDPVIMKPEYYQGLSNPMAVDGAGPHPVTKRRNQFDSPEEMYEILRKRTPYKLFEEAVLRDYCTYGLIANRGTTGYMLACTPQFEAAVYQTGTRFKDIYAVVRSVHLPVTVVRAMEPLTVEDTSSFLYSPTWSGLAGEFTQGEDVYLPEETHFLPMQKPALVAGLILEQERRGGSLASTANGVSTLPDILRHSATRYPDNEAVVDDGHRYTYAELYENVRRMASLLCTLGLRKGDRVALLQPPSTIHTIATFGVLEIGAIPVALHVRESSALLVKVTEQYSPRILIYDGVFAQQAKEIRAKRNSITTCVCAISPLSSKEDRSCGDVVFSDDVVIPADLYKFQPDLPPAQICLDDIAAIVLSSGTTGVPKGIAHTHRTLSASARCGSRYLLADERAVGINVFSTAFIGWYNCTTPFMFSGAKVVYLTQWFPDVYLDTIEKEKVTSCVLVPTMWRTLIKAYKESPHRVDTLKRVAFAGERIDAATLTDIRTYICPNVMNTYGATETGTWGGCTVMLPNDYKNGADISSIGKAAVEVQIAIITEGETVHDRVAPGVIGELIIKGPSVANQIWKRPDLTKKIFDQGWWRSGDLAYMDQDGYVFIQGRADDMIISGGINVMPGQIEKLLLEHSSIKECAVIGLPHENWGQEIVGVLIVDQVMTEAEVCGFMNASQLSKYKKPRRYFFVDDFPKGNTGKINRKRLIDQLKEH